MAIQDLSNDYYAPSDLPDWQCPVCRKGTLRLKDLKQDVKTIEAVKSKKLHSHEEWDPDWIWGVFIGKLTCENSKCQEVLVFSGKIGIIYSYDDYDYDDHYRPSQVEAIKPEYFNPPLEVFHIHDFHPKEFREMLTSSFSLFWIDVASCANKIRTIVEHIMDEQGVRKLDSRRKSLSLHGRIKAFERKNKEVADLLMAVKWIGNKGSHKDKDLTDKNILDGFTILEYSLDKLYNPHPKHINSLAKLILKHKGPVKSRKKRRQRTII